MSFIQLSTNYCTALDTLVSGVVVYSLINAKHSKLSFHSAKLFTLAVTLNCALLLANVNLSNFEELTWSVAAFAITAYSLLFSKSISPSQSTVSSCFQLYQIFRLYAASNYVSPFIRFSSCAMHVYIAWYMLDLKTQLILESSLYEIFCVKGFSLMKTFSKRKLVESDIELTDDQFSNIKKYEELSIDPSKRFFLIRFLISVEFKQVTIVVLGNALAKILGRWRRLVFVAIIAIIESKNVERIAEIGVLFVIWQILAMIKPLHKYVINISESTMERMTSLLAVKLVENNDKYQHNLDMRLYYTPYSFSYSLQQVYEELGLIIGELFNIWIIAYKIGWFFIIPILITSLQMGFRFAIDRKAKHLESMASLKKTPRFYERFFNIFVNLRPIKFYAWDSIFRNSLTIDKFENCVPFLWRIANTMVDMFGGVVSEISTAATLLSYLNSSGVGISYSEMALLMDSTNALTSFTRTLMYKYREVSELLKYNGILETRFKLEKNRYINCANIADTGCAAITLEDCKFSWGKDKFSLDPVTLDVKKGKFITVVGKIGGGKSSFLEGLCGEMPIVEGQGYINGSIAYVSQKPPIWDETFRANILMDAEYNETLFNQVVNACALDTDISQFPAGDLTEIGSKGINLSGGQKVRLALARALYMQADIYLFDDVLSAVDAHVERHLVEHVLSDRGMLSGKTRVLVTHAEHVVPLSSMMITITNGKLDIAHQVPIMLACSNTDNASNKADGIKSNINSNPDSDASNSHGKAYIIRPEEGRSDVKLKYFAWFIKNSGYGAIAVLVAIKVIATYVLYISESWRISLITDENADTLTGSLKKYLIVNAAVQIATIQISRIEEWVRENYWSKPVAKKLLVKYIDSILSLPLPLAERLSGSTLQNIGSYISHRLTIYIPQLLYNGMLSSALSAFRSVIQIAKIAPLMILPALVYSIIVYYQKLFAARVDENLDALNEKHKFYVSNKYYKRLYNNRAFLRTHSLIKQYSDSVSKTLILYCKAEYIRCIVATADSIISNSLSEMVDSIIVMYNIWRFATGKSVSPGHIDVTKSLLQNINGRITAFSGHLSRFKKNIKDLTNAYIYTEELTKEAPSVIENSRPAADWPQHGSIEFCDYKMRYRPELDTVLKGLNFAVRPNEKVGVVGRTGAGKSSITYALMRLVEAESGCIKIDGIDVSTIGLFDLRSKISVIPQDPVLFEGTVRDNLDPGHAFSDDEVWAAIRTCQFADLLDTPTGKFVYDPDSYKDNGPWIEGVGLDKWIKHNGKNFSVGQRQLVSLCRALLWQRKIVVLDEATANIDGKTDQIMQEIIRREFTNCTVLTIAHRLNTIMDSDRILVMDNGVVSEFDTPDNLLANKDSHFTRLVESMQINESIKKTAK